MTRKPPAIVTAVIANEVSTRGRKSGGPGATRSARRARCARRLGSEAATAAVTPSPSPPTTRKGTCHPPHTDSCRLRGTPTTDATEKAPITAPIALPRRSGGTTSAMIDSESEVAGPPKAPARKRAASKRGEAPGQRSGERPEHEAGHRHRECGTAVEPVEERRAGDAGQRRRRGVGAPQQSEPREGNVRATRAKSGPSGMTITKSQMLMNWTAPTRKTVQPSDGARRGGITPSFIDGSDGPRRGAPRLPPGAGRWPPPAGGPSGPAPR